MEEVLVASPAGWVARGGAAGSVGTFERASPAGPWQGEVEGRPRGGVVGDPDGTAMGLDDRPADGEPHTHAHWLCSIEWLKDHLLRVLSQPWPGILYRYLDGLRLD